MKRPPETLLAPPGELFAAVRRIVRSKRIPLKVSIPGPGALKIVRGAGKRCTKSTLYAGGWIPCPQVLQLAASLAVAPKQLGVLLNALGIKVRRCGLGLFR